MLQIVFCRKIQSANVAFAQYQASCKVCLRKIRYAGAAWQIKGLVARDNEHVETPGGGRVRAVYSIPAAAGKRARAPKTASARETTTRSSSKGSDWAMPSRNIPLSGKSNPSCGPLGQGHYGLVGRNRCSEGPGCTRGGGPGWVDPVVTYSGRPIAS